MDNTEVEPHQAIIGYLENTLKQAKDGNVTYLIAVVGNDFNNGGFSMCNIVDVNSIPHVVGTLAYLQQDMLKQYHTKAVECKRRVDILA